MSTTGDKPTLKLPWPHPGQQHVLHNRKRFTWLAAGRRWRKTTLALHPVIEEVVRGGTVIWGAPTYDQVFTAWEEHQRAARRVASFNQSRMTMHLGRGVVMFRSLDDPDNARSKTASGMVIDEVGDVAAGAWAEVLRPMLIDTNGWLLAIGSPRGRNWFWQEFKRATDGAAESAAFQAPTLGCRITGDGLVRAPHPLENPDIPFTEIDHLWQTMPERVFRQEILAEFVEDGGGVFRGVRACIATDPYVRGENAQFVIGADWGRSQDYTVFTVIDATQKRVVQVDRSNVVDYTVQRGRLLALWERYGRGTIIAEANSMGQPIIEQLSRDGMRVRPFTTTNASKANAVEDLALAFERKQITLLDMPVLIDELEAFESTTTQSGMTRYSAPAGMHDDCVMSLALAWHGMGRSSSAVGAFG